MSVHTKFQAAKLEAAKPDPARRSTRTRVLMGATLVTCGGSQRVRIRDFSSKGAQVILDGGKLTKCDVLLKRGDLVAAAQVGWIKVDEVGLTFYRAVSAKDLAAN